MKFQIPKNKSQIPLSGIPQGSGILKSGKSRRKRNPEAGQITKYNFQTLSMVNWYCDLEIGAYLVPTSSGCDLEFHPDPFFSSITCGNNSSMPQND
jgi:hypothetical protein